jgi:hypothetical protein
LTQGVGQAQRVAPPRVVLGLEVAWAGGVTGDDAFGEVGYAGPATDQIDHLVDDPFHRGVSGRRSVGTGRDRDQHEEILLARGRNRRVCRGGSAHVHRFGMAAPPRTGGAWPRTEDRAEVRVPVLAEHQGVVGQLGQFPVDPQIGQDASDTGVSSLPGAFGPRPDLGRQKGRLGVVQVGGRDHDVRRLIPFLAVGAPDADSAGSGRGSESPSRGSPPPSCGAPGPIRGYRVDPQDFRPGPDLDAGVLGQPDEGIDEGPEPASRIQDALGQISVAHEPIHRRCLPGLVRQEDGRVGQDLTKSRIPEPPGHGAVHGSEQQSRQPGNPAQNLGVERESWRGERGVQEFRDREAVGFGGFREVLLQPRAGAGFDALEEFGGRVLPGDDVDGLVVPGVHAVRRIVERHEVELAVGGRPEKPVEVLERIRHQIPGRAAVPAETVRPESTGTTADRTVLLPDGHRIAFSCQQDRRRQSGDAATDHRSPRNPVRFALLSIRDHGSTPSVGSWTR